MMWLAIPIGILAILFLPQGAPGSPTTCIAIDLYKLLKKKNKH